MPNIFFISDIKIYLHRNIKYSKCKPIVARALMSDITLLMFWPNITYV